MNHLLVLNVENNNINSIEMIQSFYAPNLDCIYLHGNPITTLKSLRKVNFPKLTRLYISIFLDAY
jgi:Leucine-rich repeat (LRR) protein